MSRSSASRRSYGGQTSAERTATRRGQLLGATITLLADKGESATTMTAICTEAGLTERYFYESFRNRDEALLAALDQVCDEIATAALDAIARSAGAPRERIRAALQAFVDLVVADPARGRVAVIEATTTPALRARRRELVGWFADLVARETSSLYGDRAWPPGQARVHGIVFIAGFAEVVADWLDGQVRMEPAELVELASSLAEAITRQAGPEAP